MKAALVADIHGNSLALDKVLEDLESMGGVDEYWFLGDFAAIGPDPIGVLERITKLPNARYIRGNTDRYLYTGELPWPTFPDVLKDPKRAELHVHVARSFAWTTGAVAAAGWLPWFERLPLDLCLTLPDGTKVLAVHASPGTDDGMGIHIKTSDEELRAMAVGIEADLLVVGHTHLPFDRSIGEMRVVNPGSLSNPFPPDLRASYAVLEAEKSGYTIHHRRVDYDRQSVIEAARDVHHPAHEYIARFMRGENRKDWMK